MEALLRRLLARPRTVAAVTVGLSLAMGLGAVGIELDEDLRSVLPTDLPARLLLDEVEERFGSNDVVMVTVGAPGESVFAQARLAKVAALTRELQRLEGAAEVQSLATATRLRGEAGLLVADPVLDDPLPHDEAGLARIRERVVGDPLLRGTFLSADEQLTALLVFPAAGADQPALFSGVEAACARYEGPEVLSVVGAPAMMAVSERVLRRDLQTLSPVMLLVMAGILWVTLRALSSVLLTLLVIVLSIAPAVGLMGYLGLPFTTINNALPVFVMAIACADAIHLLARFDELCRTGQARPAAATRAATELASPVMLTSLTTAAGFLALLAAPLPSLRTLGVFIAVGVLWALVLALLLVPALLALGFGGAGQRPARPRLRRPLESLVRLVTRRPTTVALLGLSAAAVLALGTTRLSVETNGLQYFDADTPFVTSVHRVDRAFGGSETLTLLVEGDLKEPAHLRWLLEVERFLAARPEVGQATSIADVVALLAQAIDDGRPEARRIPDSRAAVAQLLLLHSLSGDTALLERLVTDEQDAGLVTARVRNLPTDAQRGLQASLRRHLDATIPAGLRARVTGSSVLTMEMADLVVASSVRSLLAALVLVWLLSSLTFRSVRIGLVTSLPLGLATLGIFGLMGYAGVELSISSAIISCITIGVGVDYAVHLVSARREAARRRPRDATKRALLHVGPPIFFNAAAVGLGFSVLLASEFGPIRQLGLLALVALLASALGAATVLAALLHRADLRLAPAATRRRGHGRRSSPSSRA